MSLMSLMSLPEETSRLAGSSGPWPVGTSGEVPEEEWGGIGLGQRAKAGKWDFGMV